MHENQKHLLTSLPNAARQVTNHRFSCISIIVTCISYKIAKKWKKINKSKLSNEVKRKEKRDFDAVSNLINKSETPIQLRSMSKSQGERYKSGFY